MSQFTDLQVATMSPLNDELQEIASDWHTHMDYSLPMSIDWQSFWQDTTRSQQASTEALRFMVNCGTKRLLNSYTISPHNTHFKRNKNALKQLSAYQLVWVNNADDVKLEIEGGVLKDYFHVEGFVQYYANMDPFFEQWLQNQLFAQ